MLGWRPRLEVSWLCRGLLALYTVKLATVVFISRQPTLERPDAGLQAKTPSALDGANVTMPAGKRTTRGMTTGHATLRFLPHLESALSVPYLVAHHHRHQEVEAVHQKVAHSCALSDRLLL